MLNSNKNTKINIFIIFFILYFLTSSSATLICDIKSPFYGLYLNTSYTQDILQTNLSIISDCSRDKRKENKNRKRITDNNSTKRKRRIRIKKEKKFGK